MWTVVKCLLLVVVAAIPVAFMLAFPSQDGAVVVDSGASTSEVIKYAKQLMLKSVRSPQTATFPADSEFVIEPLGVNEWRVQSHVNVDTAVGKQVKMPWSIEITKSGDHWAVSEREHVKSPLTKAVSESSWTHRLEKD